MQHRFASLTFVLIVGIVLISLIGGSFILLQYRALSDQEGASKEVARMRNGVVAILDVVRTRDALQEVAAAGTLEGAAGDELFESVDYLFVRADTLRQALGEQPDEGGQDLLARLDKLITGVDDVVNGSFADFQNKQIDLAQATQRAIGAISNFYDDQKQRHVTAVVRQEKLLQRLVMTTIGLILVFVAISTVAILLWRSEKMARIRRHEAEIRAHRLAYFDPLTELPNRACFMEQAPLTLAENDGPALFLIDLDEFKGINDTYGHHIGDRLLNLTAQRCQEIFRSENGLVARLGGDEFAAIMPSCEGAGCLMEFSARLIETLSEAIQHEGIEVHPRASVGIATPSQLDGELPPTLSTMMRAADYALYKAKAEGRGTSRIYDADMADALARRREMKLAMPHALDRGEFFLEFQPQVHIQTGELHGFEALVRWRRDGAIVPPGMFIEVAEEDDFITRLDQWVFCHALKEARVWNQVSANSISVSVNLSARNFRTPDIVDQIAQAIGGSGVPAELITLEITESVLIDDWDSTLAILQRLSQIGVKIALDDFGTGYSSLSYLRRLNVDEVKIDRAFVIDIETSDRTRMMLDALVDIVGSMSMQLTIEGIETEGQARILSDLGGHVGQGFLFSRPVDRRESLHIINQGPHFWTRGPKQRLSLSA